MNTFMAIMSQLFWGVTVGALSSTFSFLLKGAAMLGGLGGAGWWSLRHHRSRKDASKNSPKNNNPED